MPVAPGPCSSAGNSRSNTAAAVRASYRLRLEVAGTGSGIGSAAVADVDGLAAHVAVIAVAAVVAAQPGQLPAAVEGLELLGADLVDVHLAELEGVGDPHGRAQALGEHVRGEPVVGRVGPADDLLLVVEGEDGQDRPEHLPLDDLGVVGHAGEHGRGEPVAAGEPVALGPAAAQHHLGPAGGGLVNQVPDLVPL